MALALLLPAALGYLVLGMLNTGTLASRWFFRHRGLALGIAAVATSGGGLVTPLLGWAMQLYGWRMALVYESASILLIVVLLLTVLIVKDSPDRMGLARHPENNGREEARMAFEAARDSASGLAGELRRWGTILGNRAFWAPSLLVATISGISQAIVTAAVPYGIQLGFAAKTTFFLVTAFSIAAAMTKILAGVLSDFVDKRLVLIFAALCMMASLSFLSFFQGSYGALLAASCLAGMALARCRPVGTDRGAFRGRPLRRHHGMDLFSDGRTDNPGGAGFRHPVRPQRKLSFRL